MTAMHAPFIQTPDDPSAASYGQETSNLIHTAMVKYRQAPGKM